MPDLPDGRLAGSGVAGKYAAASVDCVWLHADRPDVRPAENRRKPQGDVPPAPAREATGQVLCRQGVGGIIRTAAGSPGGGMPCH